MRRQHVAVLLLLAACAEAAGPRPRPGTPADSTGVTASAVVWYALEPRVVTLGQTDSVRLTARFNGNVTAHVIARSGEHYTMRRDGAQYTASLPVSSLLGDYRPGDLHTIGAQLTISGQSTRTNISLNIRDGSLPSVAIRALGAGVQATDRIVNIRLDTTFIGQTVPNTIIREVFRYLPDTYDFIAVVEAVRSSRNRTYQGVRNSISGIGLTSFDFTAQFGSAGSLQGIVQYPNDDVFDLAETGTLRVVGERWMNFTRVGTLTAGRPYWPLSSLAYGIMGMGDGSSTQSIAFPYRLTAVTNGYRLDQIEPPTEFNDFELYLMGLLPPEQVRSGIVFRDQGLIRQVRNGAVIAGPVDSVRSNDIIAVEGPRNPPASTAPRTFRLATVVLSRGRLLTGAELSFFDHMAARGEAESVLPYAMGFARGETRPFFLATGQRARLVTRL